MKSWTWDSDKIVSFSAILISLLTLFISIQQYKSSVEQQKLSVLPYLSSTSHNTGGASYTLMLENNGIGPAFVDSVHSCFNGRKEEFDLIQILAKMYPVELDSIKTLVHSNIYPGMMIPAGAKIPMLQVSDARDGQRLLKLVRDAGQKNLEVQLVYSSIFKDRWRLNLGETQPVKVD